MELSTEAVPIAKRPEYWIDAICKVFVHLDCDVGESSGSGFFGFIRQDTLAQLQISRVNSSAQQVFRTGRLIAAASEDFFLVSIQRKGCGIICQDGRRALLRPGDFALYDSTRPYELIFDDSFEQIVLMFPGEILRAYVKESERLTATAISGRAGAGYLLITMIETLRRDLDHLRPASAAAIADGAVNILVAGLRTLPSAQRLTPPNLAQYHIARIKAFVDAHMTDPGLSIGSIAGALNICASHVHRLFRTEPLPLGQYIWSRRLEACKRDLADPSQAGFNIGTIALKRGFNNAAHFSRTFRSRYGLSPKHYRDLTSSRTPRAALGRISLAGLHDRVSTNRPRDPRPR